MRNECSQADPTGTSLDLDIPEDFMVGVATSAWQIEGDLAGRGRCNWDDFADTPGKITDGATGEPACDHVNRVNEDMDLLSWLGVDSYSFTFSWARILKSGTGSVNQAGLAFYDRLIDGLLDRGIEPFATLYHWDTPSDLEQAGGWVTRDTARAFADYAQVVAENFADRVTRWATVNEPWCPALLGYAGGNFAPGRQEPDAAFAAAYHLMVGHSWAMQRLREAGATNLGIMINVIPTITDDQAMADAAHHIDGIQNRLWLDLLSGQGIPEDLRCKSEGITDWGFARESDLDTIATPLDWIGENYYTINRIVGPEASEPDIIEQNLSMYPGSPPFAFGPRTPLTDMGWEVFPPVLRWALDQVAEALPSTPIYICENGAAVPEETDAVGVHDSARIEYLHDHLSEVLQARRDGIDVRGYNAWSLLDNLEWDSGWTKKFGLIRVDPQSGTRTPKDSAHWFRRQLTRRKA